MIKSLLFVVCFLFSGLLRGQEITDEFMDSLSTQEKSYMVDVKAVNHLLKSAALTDTITYFRKFDKISYSYKGLTIANPLVGPSREKSTTSCVSDTCHQITVMCYLRIGHDNYIRVEDHRIFESQLTCHPKELEASMVLSHLTSEVLDHGWVKYDQFGNPLLAGKYQQVDSIYTDSTVEIDPETYEPIYTSVQRNKYPKKVGIWRHFNTTRDTLKVEHYPEKYE